MTEPEATAVPALRLSTVNPFECEQLHGALQSVGTSRATSPSHLEGWTLVDAAGHEVQPPTAEAVGAATGAADAASLDAGGADKGGDTPGAASRATGDAGAEPRPWSDTSGPGTPEVLAPASRSCARLATPPTPVTPLSPSSPLSPFPLDAPAPPRVSSASSATSFDAFLLHPGGGGEAALVPAGGDADFPPPPRRTLFASLLAPLRAALGALGRRARVWRGRVRAAVAPRARCAAGALRASLEPRLRALGAGAARLARSVTPVAARLARAVPAPTPAFQLACGVTLCLALGVSHRSLSKRVAAQDAAICDLTFALARLQRRSTASALRRAIVR